MFHCAYSPWRLVNIQSLRSAYEVKAVFVRMYVQRLTGCSHVGDEMRSSMAALYYGRV